MWLDVTCRTNGRMRYNILVHFESLVDDRIILKCVLKKVGAFNMWTGL
jgi:hypothetical protein